MSWASRWNSVSVPIHNSSVATDGRTFSGDVYVTWNGDYEVHSADGSITTIAKNRVGSVMTTLPEHRNSVVFAFENWRFIAPPALIFGLMFLEICRSWPRRDRARLATA